MGGLLLTTMWGLLGKSSSGEGEKPLPYELAKLKHVIKLRSENRYKMHAKNYKYETRDWLLAHGGRLQKLNQARGELSKLLDMLHPLAAYIARGSAITTCVEKETPN